MKVNFILLFTAFILVSNLSAAQPSKMHFEFAPGGIVKPTEILHDWNPVLQSIEVHTPDAGAERNKLSLVKKQADSIYAQPYLAPYSIDRNQRSINTPFLGRNFYGNPYNNSVPNDNDVAISNNNKVVSVINSSVRMYDLNLDTAYQALSLFSFTAALGLPNSHFDPKVLYDPQADRFVLMCLNGFTDTTSFIVIGFSQSNDPRQDWVFYEITGNPYNDTLWTDYPMISVTQQHLYLTVNLLKNNESWQNGFVKTLVWQFNKADGYNGQVLNSYLYGQFKYNNKYIRNMCPVRNSNEQLLSDTMYFLSNRNFAVSGDSIFLIKMPDNTLVDTNDIEVLLYKANENYHVPPDAKQTPPRFLQTNDARILGAFLHNNKIQFVSNTRDTVANKAACYHGILDLQNPLLTVNAYTIRNDTVEYGYPNIAYAGSGSADHKAIIAINYTAETIYPACGAILTDGEGSYSDLLTIRKGDNYISVLSTQPQRWGDYSGAQRKYNENGKVWVALTYGAQSKKQNTWIAEISTEPIVSVNDIQHSTTINQLYPVPASNNITCSFSIAKAEYIYVDVLDASGRVVLNLFRERAKAGTNTFSCNTTALTDGTYILLIRNHEGAVLSSEKFVVTK